ncbi:MAG: DUF1211 domain-containing protein [Bauldia sp.]|nr:DUF1211 domain-containing protein [Bauldia sp.]
MTKGRVEAFSDGVIAIIITIMVLEMKVPHGEDLRALVPLAPVFLSYVLSFANIGIFWNNHHHMLHAAKRVDGRVLWANLYFLFWLSLMPFVTGWMGENHFAPVPVAIYGVVQLMSAVGYTILAATLVAANGKDSQIAQALGHDFKAKLSLVAYVAAIVVAYFSSIVSMVLYFAVAIVWLVPDRRIERVVRD